MDEPSLSSYAPDRYTESREPTKTPKSFDHDGSQAQGKKDRLSQARLCGYPYPATYPQMKNGKSRRLPSRQPLSPTLSNPKQRRTVSTSSTNSIFSKGNCRAFNPTQLPESVDRVQLPFRPINAESVVNGPVVEEFILPVQVSKKMESSRRLEYEPTGITDQRATVPEAVSSAPESNFTEASTSNPGASWENTSPVTRAFTSLSKNDEIQLYTLLQRISRLREIIWGLRSRVQEQRGILRSKQYSKAAADDKYMQLARLKESGAGQEGYIKTIDGKSLQELFQECEQVRAEYGPLEDDCNALEDQLGSQEYELTRLEKNFVKISNLAIPLNVQSPEDDILTESRSDRSGSDVYQKYHPLVAEYLSKMGDVDILSERLERHLEERDALEAEKQSRRGVNLSLAPEDEAWLLESGAMENIILRELHEAQAEAEKLREKCIDKGLLDKYGEPKDFQTQEQEAFEGDVDAKGQKSEYLKYPILLRHPGTTEMEFKSSAPKPEDKSESAGDHINQWLLHSLRCSPLDVGLLARTFEAEVGRAEGQKWESDVLDHWYKDGAIKGASGYRIYSATSQTPIRGRSKHSTVSLPEHTFEPVLGVTGRKAARSDTSSGSGSAFLEIKGRDETVVEPLPRSKFGRTQS